MQGYHNGRMQGQHGESGANLGTRRRVNTSTISLTAHVADMIGSPHPEHISIGSRGLGKSYSTMADDKCQCTRVSATRNEPHGDVPDALRECLVGVGMAQPYKLRHSNTMGMHVVIRDPFVKLSLDRGRCTRVERAWIMKFTS